MIPNEALVNSLNHNMALLTLLGFILAAIWAVKLALFRYTKLFTAYDKPLKLFTPYLVPFGFILTLFAALMSLYYQFGLGIIPCELCWFGRTMMYPLVLIFGLAWLRREKIQENKLTGHIILISSVGLFISMYHHYLQLGYNLYKPCSTAIFAADCSKPTFIEYGFITYPFMAAVAFMFAILIALTSKVAKK